MKKSLRKLVCNLARSFVIAITAMSMTFGLATATMKTAHADLVQVWDSVEGATPWTRWEGDADGDGITGYDINGRVANFGVNNGWLYVGNGWAANRLAINITSWLRRDRCAAAVSVQVLASGAFVGLQIWNPNGWRIIAETYPWIVGNGTGYHQIVIPNLNLTNYSGTIYLQVIYGNSDNIKKFVRFDDLILECTF